MEIKLIAPEDLQSIIPLLKILNPEIGDEVLQARLQDMLLQGYQCVGAYEKNQLIAICGLWLLTKYYVGKHIEPDNMIVHPEYRSRGIGKKIMAWIYAYAKSQGCVASELNCYLGNEKGHDFWESEGYQVIAKHYQKKFEA